MLQTEVAVHLKTCCHVNRIDGVTNVEHPETCNGFRVKVLELHLLAVVFFLSFII